MYVTYYIIIDALASLTKYKGTFRSLRDLKIRGENSINQTFVHLSIEKELNWNGGGVFFEQ